MKNLKFGPVKYTLLASAVISMATSAVASAAQIAEDARIYLEEPEVAPAPRVSVRQKVEDKFEDGTLRLERMVARLSDDSYMNDGEYAEYYKNGQKFVEGVFKKGVFEGPWNYWHPNGQLCKKVIFKGSKPHGQWDVFLADGTLQASKSYQDGLRDGKWFVYYGDGKQVKVEVNYKQGKPHGDRVSYFENGQMHQQAHFEDGQRSGKVTEWAEAGNKIAEANYVNGQIEGDVKRFDNEKK